MKTFQDEFYHALSSGFGHSGFSSQREGCERKTQLVHVEVDRKLQAAREQLEIEARVRAPPIFPATDSIVAHRDG
jgi:hypothetical protein